MSTVDPAAGTSTRYASDHVIEVAPLGLSEIVSVRGLPVTTPARTVADRLHHLAALDGVPIADAALHRGLVTLDGVLDVLKRQVNWPYAGIAAMSLPLVDGRRESPLESRSAVVMHRYELPPPEPQVTIYDLERTVRGEGRPAHGGGATPEGAGGGRRPFTGRAA
jgi:hypothetical protein